MAAGGLFSAGAQNLSVDTPAVSFLAAAGGAALNQNVNVSSSGGPVDFFIYATAPWLTASPMSGVAPGEITITADPTGLAAGVYSYTLNIYGGTGPAASVRIAMTVSPIGVFPSFWSPVWQIGGSAQMPTESFTLSGQPTGFTVSASSQGGWLQVTPAGGSSPGAITASLNAAILAGMAAGTYDGSIVIAPAGAAAFSIPVTLTVASAPQVSFTSTSLTFNYQTGGSSNLTVQTIQLSTDSPQAVTYSVTGVEVDNGAGMWLTVSGAGTIPGPITVTVAPSGLASGTYTGSFTAVSTGAPASQKVTVKVVVSASPLLTVPAAPLSFAYQAGQSAPAAQSVTVLSTSGGLLLTLSATSSGNWLIVPATAEAGSPFPVSVNIAALTVGSYSGTITVSAPGAANSPQQIQATLKVSNDPIVQASAASLVFAYQTTQAAPGPQMVALSSTGLPLNYSVTAAGSTCNSTWLSASPVSNGAFSVSADPSGIGAGSTCAGSIAVAATNPATGAGVLNSPLIIPVAMYVSAGPLMVASPAAAPVFSAPAGASAAVVSSCGTSWGGSVCTINLTSTSAANALSLAVASRTDNGGAWLSAALGAGYTPGALNISAVPTGLAAGTYTGSVWVTATSAGVSVAGSPYIIPVTLHVTAGSLAVSSSGLNFVQVAGGSAPAAQIVSAISVGQTLGYSVSVAGGTGWLTATPATGSTPGGILVSADGSKLSPGNYQGTVAVAAAGPGGTPAAGSPALVGVSLSVVSPVPLSVSPATLNFIYAPGGAAPPAQTVQISGGDVSFTTQVTGSWLQVSPTSGGDTGPLSVTVNPQGLKLGSYSGSIAINSPFASNAPTITVNLTVSATLPVPQPTAVTNAASYASGAVSPGENIAIFGTGIGPASLANGVVTNGAWATMAGETRVLFDGEAAPVIYASNFQTSVMVPYSVAGRASTSIVVEYQGVQSKPLTYTVTPQAPGVYTMNAQGYGPGAILNADYSLNASNPAAKGSAVLVYMTGEGLLSPSGTSGNLADLNLKYCATPVLATVGGIPATVYYAGSAPGLVYGVMQVNVEIPATAPSGAQALLIGMGAAGTIPVVTQAGVTVAVQ
jgi:uncharacterized protein (TIGR03437 family)